MAPRTQIEELLERVERECKRQEEVAREEGSEVWRPAKVTA